MNRNRHLNIQLFANANTNVTTQTGLTDEMKTYYESMLIKLAEESLIFDQFGQKKPIPKNGGKEIEFRKYDSLPKAMTALTEGVTPDGQSISMDTISATISQYGAYITLSDILTMTAIDNNIVEATELSGSQAGRTLNTVTRDVLSNGTNVLFAPKGDGTAVTARSGLDKTCVLTPELFLKASTILRRNIAEKIDGSYVAIVHPDVAMDLKKSTGFVEWNKYTTPEKMWKGEIGELYGIRIIENSEARILKDDTCPTDLAVYQTIVMGANAYGVTEVEGGGLQHIVKPLGAGDDPLNQRATVGWKATKAAERLVEQYMIRIESISPEFSATAQAN